MTRNVAPSPNCQMCRDGWPRFHFAGKLYNSLPEPVGQLICEDQKMDRDERRAYSCIINLLTLIIMQNTKALTGTPLTEQDDDEIVAILRGANQVAKELLPDA